MNKITLLFTFLIGTMAICLWALWPSQKTTSDDKSLTLYCAAGLQSPVEEIIEDYHKLTGRTVKVIYNGSGALLSQIKIAPGDLYLPANNEYIRQAESMDLTMESIPAASMTAVLVVAKDNQNIQDLDDLTQEGIRISFADSTAAIGKHVRQVLSEHQLLAAIEKNVTVTKPTVNNIIEDVALGSVDATIAWDAVANHNPKVKTIPIPIFHNKPRVAEIAVLRSSKEASAALHFARYLSAKDRGLKTFAQHGFQVSPQADLWKDVPEILLFSGSMLRPAIQDGLREFEQREGCRISTVYEGCGTLVAQMKAGAQPEFYFSCDVTFLDQVQDRFEPGTVISQNEIILLVPKGNPKNIRTLDDLNKANLKVGVAHPVKSALGKLTHDMLKASSHLKPLEASGNIIILASKGDELVTQMQAGALDAALLYRSNAKASEAITKHCSIISLNRTDAIATQPFAIAVNAQHPQMMRRLGAYLSNKQAEQRFKHFGFTWKKETHNRSNTPANP
ncbi:molybdate ABC transporter substrate-binding protein [Verrucomicrobiaceae bacterium N1E253]|uniref:Molybdate ABC transporter substrate-binding protein n=1 Tax=Oceaniferula marina TaxID=2748318 RepID=A0A851GGW5_9BACT|nr:molybdate ABC transporter substrate-binding protein [Oceaniferula marina]NWK54367.1 molybdate ABC transporter substrate-binding protein [Oceaniferula marina]